MGTVNSVTTTLRTSGTRVNSLSTRASSTTTKNMRSNKSSYRNPSYRHPVKSFRSGSRINNSEPSFFVPKVNGSRAFLQSAFTGKTHRITSKKSQQGLRKKYSVKKNGSFSTAIKRKVSATSTYEEPKTLQHPAKKQKVSASSTSENLETLPNLAKKQKDSATSTSENPETSLNNTITTHEETHKQKRTKESICCTVCLDTIDVLEKEHRLVVSTKCGHIFCKSCIQKSISNGHGCPTCRRKLTKSGFHTVYL